MNGHSKAFWHFRGIPLWKGGPSMTGGRLAIFSFFIMLLGAAERLYGALKTTLWYNKLHCAILLDNYHCTPRDFLSGHLVTLEDRQKGPLLGGRVRISHPYICQTRSAQAMRLCMTKYLTTTTEAARSKRQSPTRSAGAAGGERGLGSRRDTRRPNQQCVGRR